MKYIILVLLLLAACGRSQPHNAEKPDTVESLKEDLQVREQEILNLQAENLSLQEKIDMENNYNKILFTQFAACINSHESLFGIATDFVPSVTQDEGALYPIAMARALITADFKFEEVDYQEIRDYLDHLIDPDKALPSKEDDTTDQ